MSVFIARLLGAPPEMLLELGRFWSLRWGQQDVPSYAVWWRLVLKRAVDFTGALVLVVLLSPALAAIALAITLDSAGPILFTQERVGLFGRVFRIYKFRTMVANAEVLTGPVWAAREGDPRVTRVGRFLRRTHLDELLQLLNVLKGDMSLVGPRPERPCFVTGLQREVAGYDHRLYVRPGITGLAQIHYRYDQTVSDVRKKLRFDLLYVKRMCLMLDARILVWTMAVVLTGRGIK
ncbi:MAG: sugar transferase [Candidatus Omnitrophica bacterium]|nr:sugar transferase [Candidatus Omnitrophota bacterium]